MCGGTSTRGQDRVRFFPRSLDPSLRVLLSCALKIPLFSSCVVARRHSCGTDCWDSHAAIRKAATKSILVLLSHISRIWSPICALVVSPRCREPMSCPRAVVLGTANRLIGRERRQGFISEWSRTVLSGHGREFLRPIRHRVNLYLEVVCFLFAHVTCSERILCSWLVLASTLCRVQAFEKRRSS